MGRGNWRPSNEQEHERGCEYFYVDYSDIYTDPKDDDLCEFEMNSFINETIGRFLPISFERNQIAEQKIFENGLLKVSLYDNENSVVVAVEPRDIFYTDYKVSHVRNLAKHQLTLVYQKLLYNMNSCYDIYFRATAWTSRCLKRGEMNKEKK